MMNTHTPSEERPDTDKEESPRPPYYNKQVLREAAEGFAKIILISLAGGMLITAVIAVITALAAGRG